MFTFLQKATFAAALMVSTAASASVIDTCRVLQDNFASSSAAECLNLSMTVRASDNVLEICEKMARNYQSDNAIRCLRAADGIVLPNPSALAVCKVLNSNLATGSALNCLEELKRIRISPRLDGGAIEICEKLASEYMSDQALTCLKVVGEGFYFDQRAVRSCMNIKSKLNNGQAVECLRRIRDLDFTLAPAIDMCETHIERYQMSSAIECLERQGRPVIAAPVPPPVIVVPSQPRPPVIVVPSQPRPPVIIVTPAPAPSKPHAGETPKVDADLCYVAKTKQWVKGDDFFKLVSEFASRNHKCAVAKISRVSSSGRIYDVDGSRVEKSKGGLSNKEVDDILRAKGMLGCERFSCEEKN